MDDASRVRVPERIGNRHADPDRFCHSAGTLHQAIAKRHALDVFHDHHERAVIVDDVVHLGDARVGQAAGGASLAKDACGATGSSATPRTTRFSATTRSSRASRAR